MANYNWNEISQQNKDTLPSYIPNNGLIDTIKINSAPLLIQANNHTQNKTSDTFKFSAPCRGVLKEITTNQNVYLIVYINSAAGLPSEIKYITVSNSYKYTPLMSKGDTITSSSDYYTYGTIFFSNPSSPSAKENSPINTIPTVPSRMSNLTHTDLRWHYDTPINGIEKNYNSIAIGKRVLHTYVFCHNNSRIKQYIGQKVTTFMLNPNLIESDAPWLKIINNNEYYLCANKDDLYTYSNANSDYPKKDFAPIVFPLNAFYKRQLKNIISPFKIVQSDIDLDSSVAVKIPISSSYDPGQHLTEKQYVGCPPLYGYSKKRLEGVLASTKEAKIESHDQGYHFAETWKNGILNGNSQSNLYFDDNRLYIGYVTNTSTWPDTTETSFTIRDNTLYRNNASCYTAPQGYIISDVYLANRKNCATSFTYHIKTGDIVYNGDPSLKAPGSSCDQDSNNFAPGFLSPYNQYFLYPGINKKINDNGGTDPYSNYNAWFGAYYFDTALRTYLKGPIYPASGSWNTFEISDFKRNIAGNYSFYHWVINGNNQYLSLDLAHSITKNGLPPKIRNKFNTNEKAKKDGQFSPQVYKFDPEKKAMVSAADTYDADLGYYVRDSSITNCLCGIKKDFTTNYTIDASNLETFSSSGNFPNYASKLSLVLNYYLIAADSPGLGTDMVAANYADFQIISSARLNPIQYLAGTDFKSLRYDLYPYANRDSYNLLRELGSQTLKTDNNTSLYLSGHFQQRYSISQGIFHTAPIYYGGDARISFMNQNDSLSPIEEMNNEFYIFNKYPKSNDKCTYVIFVLLKQILA